MLNAFDRLAITLEIMPIYCRIKGNLKSGYIPTHWINKL